MKCSECGAEIESSEAYHTRPDNLAACPGAKAESPKAEPVKDDPKPARKSRAKK